MKPGSRWVAAALVAVSCPPAFGQAPEGLIPPAVNPFALRFMVLIGDRSLSVRLVVSTTSGEVGSPSALTFSMPALIKGGGCRTTVELAAMPQLTPGQRADLKRQRMERLVTIGLTQARVGCFVYPDLRAYVELAAPESAPALVESNDLGEERLDGHWCAKRRVVIADATGRRESWTVWLRDGPRGLPVQIIRAVGSPGTPGSTVATLRFEGLDARPRIDDALFLPPAGYRRFGSVLAFTRWVTEEIAPSP